MGSRPSLFSPFAGMIRIRFDGCNLSPALRKRDTPAHVTLAEQAPALTSSGSWTNDRKSEPAAPGWIAVVVSGLQRFFLALALLVGFTIGVSLLYAYLAGGSARRAIALGFYIIGASLAVGGSLSSAPLEPTPYRLGGETRRRRTMNSMAVSLVYGLILVAIGVAVDARRALF
jgi:hypothetical protein